ncbi:MAG: Phosphomannomutase/phosphoglucomutase [Syntrophorhabdaceae bacterium PtaU1.Bin034]|jgi:phosphomannomutase/phosphoglucomutase|nr:MAG: Phosphomannomutase/phosphoglucomutase [Syntrophorhabdaceae bacterium PtaU1.Bin034]
MNRDIFREYDIRGLVGKDLTDEVVRNIGRAFSTYMVERGKTKASVGRDCRLSSDRFGNLIMEGMTEGGLSVTDLGVLPTPLFYFSLFNLDVEGGIMVTGSHNPPDHNGFKVAFGKRTIFGKEIQEIGDIIEAGRYRTGRGSLSEYPRIKEDYYNFLRGNIAIERKLKVVVDAGNGTGGVVACPIMEEMGQDVIPLFCDMDGHFPNHFPDPTVEKNLQQLREEVLRSSADLGIGYDGDADRIGVVDNEGNIIWGDYLMLIFARDILKRHKGGTFVSEVKCSKNLFEDIEKKGGKAIMWKAGHSLIKQKMKETNALFGGEMSGHMFFAERFFGYDDAIYASLRLLEILSKDSRRLSEFLKDLSPSFSTPEIRIDCPEHKKFKVVKRITDYYREKFDIVDTDGVRVMLPDGWGLVRASNTQAILVLRFEAESEQALERIRAMVETDLERIMNEEA